MNPLIEVKVPELGESIREATVGRWLKSAGDRVEIDEVLLDLETDKVTLEVNAPAAGILTDLRASEGDSVAVDSILCYISQGETSGMKVPAQEKEGAREPVKKGDKISQLKETPPHLTSSPTSFFSAQKPMTLGQFAPSVRKLAEELKIKPGNVSGTGKGSRVTKGDMLAHELTRPSQGTTPPNQNTMPDVSELAPQRRVEKRVKMTSLRQLIAKRLKYSQNTAAILTTFNEVDMTVISELRNRYKEAFEKKHGVKLGFMSFFVKACLQALQEMPSVNAELDDDMVVYKNYYDIGVAVSTPQGLVVPILRDANLLSFAGLEKAIGALSQKAREGKLTMAEITGGTFTISNGGVFGSLLSTPILNPPQVGILGMHKIQERPVAIAGKVEIRPMMYVALSYDHRLVDGRESVSFLVRIKESLENPEKLMLDL